MPYDISVTFSKAAISPYTLTRTLSCPRYARQQTHGPVDNRINFRRSVSTQPMLATSLERTTRWRMRCLALPLTRLNLHKVSISMSWPLLRIAMTRWPEAIPVSDTSGLSLARALLQNWVSRFGTPEHITSDRGSQFTSILWSKLSILLGTELHHTTSYHPQANRMVERFHRDMKAALRSWLNGPNLVD